MMKKTKKAVGRARGGGDEGSWVDGGKLVMGIESKETRVCAEELLLMMT
jgi:hypothetical protein